ncbi:hypothetical protein O181_079114 [Austropuccinia psidii MF-1]|uniref:Uncharacterized protein n=1 Tax=Austropuccinia psidii MF-1 TaxID=1389203 RepID=A0A9Q3FHU4_9BASI|nr:hypothetical protein [Austropuccinia psidii MF-1]
MDLKPPEVDSSGISKDYFNIFREDTGYIGGIEKDLINEELNYDKIKLLEKRKAKELENKSSIITEDKLDQFWDRNINKRIQQRMETVLEGKLVELEDDLVSYQQNNVIWTDNFKQGRRFEDLEEGELSENAHRIA